MTKTSRAGQGVRVRWWMIAIISGSLACVPAEEPPRSGQWEFSDAQIVANECGFPESDLVQKGSLHLLSSDDGATTIALPDNPDPILCTGTDGVLSCVDDTPQEVAAGEATIIVGTSIEVVFMGAESGDVTEQLVASCVGVGCDVAANALGTDFPCTVDLHYTVTWQSEDLGVLATAR